MEEEEIKLKSHDGVLFWETTINFITDWLWKFEHDNQPYRDIWVEFILKSSRLLLTSLASFCHAEVSSAY